jgi:hypothetical protein
MKASELRVGNHFIWSMFASMGRGQDVVTLNNIGYHQLMDPIPLTEEWLLERGFKNTGMTNETHLKKDNFHLVEVMILILTAGTSTPCKTFFSL